eukprot:CAMPEP_0117083312 /NCGR_PEP_ID=MMETSP0472-20121206/58661_1 /TAXON_ID=693140 ORGANISM="Tiarina fusus, Strain LIS" /NCGR_SAMPLE_ID=MMETSP0472 /ASSEMBLY_ACC=CAM_ASM_000603 /LENGTH=212 /DNA_ID=CAMNT_0004811893 /DNA_START=280 /DNA_END=918 /DNA_ORIENTATION=-
MSEDQEPKAGEGGVATDKESTTQSDTAENEAKKAEPANPASDDKADAGDKPKEESSSKPESGTTPIVSSSKKSRPPYKYDPDKITLRFLFANRDGLTVTVECTPADTVGEVKGALLSVWPEDLPSCSGGDQLRLVCMGKGILMPDTRTLEDCQVPVFKTHPTPINVAVRPEVSQVETSKSAGDGKQRATSGGGGSSGVAGEQASQGCACIIL